jgi:hypothetical protein
MGHTRHLLERRFHPPAQWNGPGVTNFRPLTSYICIKRKYVKQGCSTGTSTERLIGWLIKWDIFKIMSWPIWDTIKKNKASLFTAERTAGFQVELNKNLALLDIAMPDNIASLTCWMLLSIFELGRWINIWKSRFFVSRQALQFLMKLIDQE